MKNMEAKFSPLAVTIFLSTTTAIIIGFCIWFFSSTLFTKYIEYKIIFPESIAGLYVGSNVTYNGVKVGSVIDLSINEKFGNKVVVNLHINSNIKIKENTFATLNMKGITGQMFIELNGGSIYSNPLQPDKNNNRIIQYKESIFSQLTTAAPMILQQTSQLISKLEILLSGENKNHFDKLIKNIMIISEEAAKIPVSLKNTLHKIDQVLLQALPVLQETEITIKNLPNILSTASEPIIPIIDDLKAITANLSQFTDKINNQGITAMITSSRSL